MFLHGNPGPSAEWEPLLAAAGTRLRAVAFDQPGFGRATRPPGFRHSVAAHAGFLGRALDTLGIERAHLVAHDFGGPWGLAWAAGDPDRLASAVLLGTGVLPGYGWHALARIWRTRGAGELFMRTTTRPGFRLLMRRGQAVALPPAFVDHMYANFGPETRAGVLELYRAATDVTALAEQTAAALRPHDRPALVLWGLRDPYIGAGHAEDQRRAFPQAEVRVLEHCGHWPHVDEPETVAAAVCEFLARDAAQARPLGLAA